MHEMEISKILGIRQRGQPSRTQVSGALDLLRGPGSREFPSKALGGGEPEEEPRGPPGIEDTDLRDPRTESQGGQSCGKSLARAVEGPWVGMDSKSGGNPLHRAWCSHSAGNRDCAQQID